MKVAIITSSKDSAGMNIHEELLAMGFEKTKELFEGNPCAHLNTSNHTLKLITTNEDIIRCENIDEKLDADIIVFASKHKAKSEIPSLTVHSTGNFNEAQYGGREKTLNIAAEEHIKHCFQLLSQNAPEGFEVIQEATHHGPSVQKPSFFIELGSNEQGWKNKQGAKAVAFAIITCFSAPIKATQTAIAIGGPHHAPRFQKIMLEPNISISHVCPKHALEYLDEEIMNQMLHKSTKHSKHIILDWKGLGEHKQRILALAKKTGKDIITLK